MNRRSRSAAGPERGSSLVEFALVAPILFMLLFGIFEIGRRLYPEVFNAEAADILRQAHGTAFN